MEYMIWEPKPEVGCCSLLALQNVERVWDLRSGVPRAKDFPESACFHMDPAHKKAVKLADQLYNRDGLPVVSSRVKAFIEGKRIDSIEFLRVSIFDHKGRVSSEDYWIMNPLDVQDCIDTKNSKIVWNAIKKEMIASCEKLVLDTKHIDPRTVILRPKHLERVIVVRGDLAKGLADQRFTGVDVCDLDGFEV